MSRKTKKQTAPADTGGLDLNLSVTEELAIDVTAAPSNAHKAVEELESLPATNRFQEHTDVPGSGEPAGLKYPLILIEALNQSYLHIAARKTNHPEALVLSNGFRYWTVSPETMEPFLYEGVQLVDGFRDSKVWRPVAGNERGWYVG
ncbi:Uncharacterised protein [uncultured archaeon]|nr:Uncharacterised protein [uncultured archaeon]